MTQLIGCLSSGKGTWGELSKIIKSENWDNIVLITNKFGKENFRPIENTELIEVNFDVDTKILRDIIINKLKNKIKGIEVAINISSGNGKEHMALLSAILKLGVGIRFVDI
jgi:hypothetical protein